MVYHTIIFNLIIIVVPKAVFAYNLSHNLHKLNDVFCIYDFLREGIIALSKLYFIFGENFMQIS